MGGTLSQRALGDDLDALPRPIAFESRQFSAAEQNYHAGERELCAIHHCCCVAWRHYLIFTEFLLKGDHQPLKWLFSPSRELSRRQARWYMDMVEVGVPTMEHVPGVSIPVEDALSRRSDYVEFTPREGVEHVRVAGDMCAAVQDDDPVSVLDAAHLFRDALS